MSGYIQWLLLANGVGIGFFSLCLSSSGWWEAPDRFLVWLTCASWILTVLNLVAAGQVWP